MGEETLFYINPVDLVGIPGDILMELKLSESDIDNARLVSLFMKAGRPLSLNEIIIGSYRADSVKYKRNVLTSKLYRLVKSGALEAAGKGRYQLKREES